MNLRLILLIGLAICCFGPAACKPATSTSPETLAPGYINSSDQTMGTALAALNGFVAQETVNYNALTLSAQAVEKPYLNDMITAVNLANAAYKAYHEGTGTANAASTAISNAQTSQANLVAKKEAH